MAINAAKEFGPSFEPSDTDTEVSDQNRRVREQRAAEFAEINRLAQRPDILRQFDAYFPNIANDPLSQLNFNHMLSDTPFDPNVTAAFMLLKKTRVVKPHLVEVFNASEPSTKPAAAEKPIPPDPANFIG
jgi:hypothetical protein